MTTKGQPPKSGRSKNTHRIGVSGEPIAGGDQSGNQGAWSRRQKLADRKFQAKLMQVLGRPAAFSSRVPGTISPRTICPEPFSYLRSSMDN